MRLLTSASAPPAETAAHRAAALPPDPIVLDAAAADRSAAREAAELNEPRAGSRPRCHVQRPTADDGTKAHCAMFGKQQTAAADLRALVDTAGENAFPPAGVDEVATGRRKRHCPRYSPTSLAVLPGEGFPDNTVCVYLVPSNVAYEGRLRWAKRGRARMGQSRIKKRSIIVNGHKTSVSLEDEFWDELRGLAAERRVPVTALVNEIDQVPGRNLSSAIRVYLFMRAQQRRSRAA